MFFNEKQKCLYRVFNENTKCLLFHFLNALFSGLFALLCQAPMLSSGDRLGIAPTTLHIYETLVPFFLFRHG